MPENTTGPSTPLPVWRRTAGTGTPIADEDQPLRCGGPSFGVPDDFTEMRDRAWAEANGLPVPASADDREVEESEAEEPADEKDDRYAVKLLRQDDSAWGGGTSGNTGMLG